jgi:hypothetical protein
MAFPTNLPDLPSSNEAGHFFVHSPMPLVQTKVHAAALQRTDGRPFNTQLTDAGPAS